MKSREKDQHKVGDYYTKQEQIEKHKAEIRRQHEEELIKQHKMEALKEVMFNNIRRSREELEKTKLDQVFKKTEQIETKVSYFITP